jgi:hypothetical protein
MLPASRVTTFRTIQLIAAAILGTASVWIGHLYFSAGNTNVAKILAALSLATCFAAAILLFLAAIFKVPVFPSGAKGILVLRFAGDEDNSARSKLIGQLHSSIANRFTPTSI